MADWLPLTAPQRGLYFAHEVDPTNPCGVTAEVVELTGRLDPARLAAAQLTAYGEHEQLRTVMRPTAEGPQQRVVPVAELPSLEVVDLSNTADPEGAADAWIAAAVCVPFDLGNGPMVRSALLCLGSERHRWLHAAHHVVIDGYGALQLVRRIAEVYADPGRAARSGATLAEVVAEDERYRAGATCAAEEAFWETRLRGFDGVVSLAGTMAEPAAQAHRVVVPLSDELGTRLAAGARRLKVAWPDFVTAAVGAYLARVAGTPSTRVGTPLMNRIRVGQPVGAASRTVCTAMNVLPVTVAVGDHTVAALLRATAADSAEVRAHPNVRQESLTRTLGRRGAQLFGAQVNVLPFDLTLAMGEASGVVHNVTAGPVEDMTWGLRGMPGRGPLRLELDLNPRLYDVADAGRHLERMVHWLGVLADAEPDTLVTGLALLPLDELDLVLSGFNQTEHPVEFVSLPQAFAAAATKHADRAALRFHGLETTYAELDRRARRIALSLRARGVTPGTTVGVMLPRSVDLFASIQAVGMLGGVYLPLDPDHPAERHRGMVADAGAGIVVVADSLPPESPRGIGQLASEAAPPNPPISPPSALSLADAAEELARWSGAELAGLTVADPGRDDPAYLLFTSGSTGRPKGVLVGHAAIRNRLAWMQHALPLGPRSRVLHKTPISFDVSVWELYWPLTTGACVVIAPPDAHRDPLQVADLIVAEGIDLVHFVPSMLRALLSDRRARGILTRLAGRPLEVVCSGEALPRDLVELCAEHIGVRPVNLYGPTEAAVDVTAWRCAPDDVEVPIGAPIWNTRCYVLDADDCPVGVGVQGHLHLAGVQLAAGYIGRPDLTAAAFVDDPFVPGERMYRTGDLAAWRADGALRYLGRVDDQVKLHGQRLELGEVEAALSGTPGLGQVVAGLHRTASDDAVLVVWFTTDGCCDADQVAGALRKRAIARLPAGVRPTHVIAVPRIPLGTTGKADRKALAAGHPPPTDSGPVGSLPASLRIRQVCAAMATALGRDDLGADDDFFDCGGDSMRVLRLVAELEEQHGIEVTLADVFAAPTPAALAALASIGGASADELGERLVLRQGNDTRWPLVLLPPAGGIGWCYTGFLAHLPQELGVQALQTIRLPEAAPDALADLDALVARFADHVEDLLAGVPAKGVHLSGWSLGGMAAHALAAELSQRGVGVGAVVLLDAYPAAQWSTQPEPDRVDALLGLLRLAGQPDPDDSSDIDEHRVTELLRQARSPLAALPNDILAAAVDLAGRGARLVRTATRRSVDVPVTMVAAEIGRSAWLDSDGWRSVSPAGLRVVPLTAAHPELVRDPWRMEVAGVITEAVAAATDSGRG